MKKAYLFGGMVLSVVLFGLVLLLAQPASTPKPSPVTTSDSEAADEDVSTPTSTTTPTTTLPTTATGEPVIYVSIVSHNEDYLSGQYPNFSTDQAEFERQREGVAMFAAMLTEHGAKYDFQTEWNFLLGMQKYDKGTASTNGKNLIAYLSEDLGVSVDPHSHEKLGYNYADVAYLISTFGVEPSGVVGGLIAAPPEDSKLEYLWNSIEANKYNYTWDPVVGWGGGTGLHINETSLWTSGVWQPKDNEHYQEHDPNAALPVIGHYNSDWSGLDSLLQKQAAGELEAGEIYTVTIMNNQTLMTNATTDTFEKRLDTYNDETAAGRIVWATLPEVYNAWVTIYNKEPNIFLWEGTDTGSTTGFQKNTGGTGGSCGNGICELFERKKGLCTEDC